MSPSAFHLLYSLCSFPATLGAIPFLLRTERGRTSLHERFGWWSAPEEPYYWFHGASVGELQSLQPIISAPDWRLPSYGTLVTAVSASGVSYTEQQELGETHLLPLDCGCWLAPPLRKGTPKAFIFGETELWPGLLSLLQARSVPCCMVNARLRDEAWEWYSRFRFLFAPLLSRLKLVCASDQASAERLCRLGAPEERVQVTGNAKYDCVPPSTTPQESESLRQALFEGEPRPVLVLGSLHPGEEGIWIEALQRTEKRLSVILAPRHMEKVDHFRNELKQSELPYVARSERRSVPQEDRHQILLLDSLGELESMYAIADAAFVGATLIPLGGHNPFQPARYGVPPVVGPNISRIEDEIRLLEEKQGVIRIVDTADIVPLLSELTAAGGELAQTGERARSAVQSFAGLAGRIGGMIREAIEEKGDA